MVIKTIVHSIATAFHVIYVSVCARSAIQTVAQLCCVSALQDKLNSVL